MLILVRRLVSIPDTAFTNIANPNEPTVNFRMKLISEFGNRRTTYANDFKTPPRFDKKLRRHLTTVFESGSKSKMSEGQERERRAKSVIECIREKIISSSSR